MSISNKELVKRYIDYVIQALRGDIYEQVQYLSINMPDILGEGEELTEEQEEALEDELPHAIETFLAIQLTEAYNFLEDEAEIIAENMDKEKV